MTVRPARLGRSLSPSKGLAISIAAIVVALTGCSGSDEPPTTAPAPAPSTSSVSSRPFSQAPTPASTPVPPPTPGSVESTVTSRPVKEKKPIRLDRSGSAADNIQVKLSSIKAITAKAKGPGEVTGPALAVTVEIDNTGRDAFDLSGVAVTVTDADDNPGNLMSAKPASPMPGSVAGGEQARGVYVFTLPANQRDPVTVRVVASPSLPTVVFTGAGPR